MPIVIKKAPKLLWVILSVLPSRGLHQTGYWKLLENAPIPRLMWREGLFQNPFLTASQLGQAMLTFLRLMIVTQGQGIADVDGDDVPPLFEKTTTTEGELLNPLATSLTIDSNLSAPDSPPSKTM